MWNEECCRGAGVGYRVSGIGRQNCHSGENRNPIPKCNCLEIPACAGMTSSHHHIITSPHHHITTSTNHHILVETRNLFLFYYVKTVT
ncbi:MAG: hypothetical protein A2X22_12295 [Bacteroidetes bacterium GWF2_49_14]|nr:MAG: hypothetical protein A2X22_12295 [Bacteroidetes bacterium GWF2_49_14]